MRNILFLLLALTLGACGESNPEKSGMERVVLGEIASDPQREPLSLSDLGVKVEMIPLATSDSCLLGRIEQILDGEDLYIVADRQIYKFSKSGVYMGKIGQKGQGPAEYIKPEQILLDCANQVVYVLDYIGRKTMLFDMDGRFLRSYPLPDDYSLNRMALINGILHYTSYSNSLFPDLLAYDPTAERYDTLSFREREMGMEAFSGNTFIYNCQDKDYVYHYFNDTVYSVEKGRLHPSFLFELGGGLYTFDQLTMTADNQTKAPITEAKAQVVQFADLGRYLMVSYMVTVPEREVKQEGNTFLFDYRCAFYDKDHRKMFTDVSFKDEENPVHDFDGDQLFFPSSDEQSIYFCKTVPDLLENYDIEGIDEEDNPILFKYTF